MKRVAVILIIAVLALGCVFADSTQNINNGTGFTVTTEIQTIYPVYQIVGYNVATMPTSDGTSRVTGTATVSDKEIAGITSADGKTLSINVALQHYGKENNDSTKDGYVGIRYNKGVDVTITASKLANVTTKATAASGHVMESGLPYHSAFAANGTAGATSDTAFYSEAVTATTASTTTDPNKAIIKCHYVNGSAVALNTSGVGEIQTITSGSFSWDISGLTAGDTYKATVVVTYTVQ